MENLWDCPQMWPDHVTENLNKLYQVCAKNLPQPKNSNWDKLKLKPHLKKTFSGPPTCINGAKAMVPSPVPAQLNPDAKLRRLSKYSCVAATLGMYSKLNPVPK